MFNNVDEIMHIYAIRATHSHVILYRNMKEGEKNLLTRQKVSTKKIINFASAFHNLKAVII